MTDTDTMRRHIAIVAGAGGPKAMIAGHSVPVADIVVWHEQLGMSPDEIVDAIPTLTLANVHAALAYYWDNREELDRQMEQNSAWAKAWGPSASRGTSTCPTRSRDQYDGWESPCRPPTRRAWLACPTPMCWHTALLRGGSWLPMTTNSWRCITRAPHHAEIVFSKQGSRSIGEVIDFLTLIAAVYSSEEMENRVEFVF